jgi:hypothetical protein
MYGELSLDTPYLRWISTVCLIAFHVVKNPNPIEKPHAIEAMDRSALVTTSGLKWSGRRVIMVSWNIFEAIVGPREDWESNFGPRHI